MSAAVIVLILSSVDGGVATPRDVTARADKQVSLHAAVQVGRGAGCRLFTEAPRVKSACKVLPPPFGTSVHWFKVEAERAAYDNVEGGRFSFATIDWAQSPWRDGVWSLAADVRAVKRRGVAGAGTMRYQVQVDWPGRGRLSSAGLEAGAGGPTERADIRKVTLRPDDSYLGYMAELAGLPYVFGSAAQGRQPHQAERRIGVDCADLMIYGLRRLGHDVGYRSSRTLGPVSRALVPRVEARRQGVYMQGGRAVPVGPRGVQPGDWIIFDGHVGAFVRDRGRVGVLDEEDLLMHIAWKELAVETLAASGYGGVSFEVRRPKALAQSGSN